jgi:hypothetical protein
VGIGHRGGVNRGADDGGRGGRQGHWRHPLMLCRSRASGASIGYRNLDFLVEGENLRIGGAGLPTWALNQPSPGVPGEGEMRRR